MLFEICEAHNLGLSKVIFGRYNGNLRTKVIIKTDINGSLLSFFAMDVFCRFTVLTIRDTDKNTDKNEQFFYCHMYG